MKIAIDAMGGDKAPGAIVEGALQAARDAADVELVLVGAEAVLSPLLDRRAQGGRVSILHAADVIRMGESPVEALRRKADASVLKAAGLVRSGEAQAFISAGDTGAAVASAAISLRLLEGVRKPGIAVTVPSAKGRVTLIDVGANIYAKPQHLYQYAVMASLYAASRNGGGGAPRVGLLNIGEETEKGTDLVRETHALLAKSRLNFVGNVEGKDIFKGACDVLVCEGFVGNVVLKMAEGLAETLISEFKNEVRKRLLSRLGAALMKPILREFRDLTDYSQYGGAPLLGTEGICIICHGRSDARAIRNAVRVAGEMVRARVNDRIVADLKANGTSREGGTF